MADGTLEVDGATGFGSAVTVNPGGTEEVGLALTLLYSALDTWTTGPEFTKYQGSNAIPCSPFNGPGGPANPDLVMKVNGSSVGARQYLPPVQCPNASDCTSSLMLDPVAYASPGQFYDSNNNLIGPSTNPFALAPNVALAYNPDHQGQWSQDVSSNWGEFSKKTFSGGSYWYKWSMCSGGVYSPNGC